MRRLVSSVSACLAASGCVLFESFPEVAAPTDASVVDSGPDSAPFDPSALPRLALWLDGSQGVVTTATGVVTWTDRAKGNDATQLDRGFQPTLRAAALNGHPVVHFSGNDQFLVVPDNRALQFGTEDFTVMVVVSWTNFPKANDQNGGYAALFVKSSPYPPFTGAALFGNDIILQNGSVRAQVDYNTSVDTDATTLNDGKFHIVGMQRKKGILSVRADGVTAGSGVDGSFDVSALGMGVYIGGRDPLDHANQALRGDIAELIAVAGAVSDDDLRSLEAYFGAKYGL